ncbi:MAG: hypothetical protein OEW84_08885, partial [Aigarchaeota archaeon]|nr:hypothetical protein [Aigarchaeota archaeon]
MSFMADASEALTRTTGFRATSSILSFRLDRSRRAFGTRLIERLELGNAQSGAKEELKSLYSTLSKYVHSTYEELEPAVKKGRVDARVLFAFDPELFEKC